MPGINILAHAERPQETRGNSPLLSPAAWPYVSQFILGPAFAERLAGWQRITVAEQIRLTAHPALACTQVADHARELTLIGHILDPLTPGAANADILRALLRHFTSREALIVATDGLGGRWLLIATNSRESFLFHDALGLRQAFHTEPAEIGALWVMSQPGLASEVLSLAPDEQALDYMDTQTFRRASEYRFPVTASTFRGIKHLVPNHWLDLKTGRSHRYWPLAPLEILTPEAAIDRLGTLMSGMIRAAASRFELAFSLTAGLDSRLVLAAARGVADRLSIMTLRQGRMCPTITPISKFRRGC